MPGIIKAIDDLIPTLDDNTRLFPGHGPISGKQDVINCRNMIATIAGRVEAMVKGGKTLAEVVAAKPTKDFDAQWIDPDSSKPRYGDEFAEMIYYGYAPVKK